MIFNNASKNSKDYIIYRADPALAHLCSIHNDS